MKNRARQIVGYPSASGERWGPYPLDRLALPCDFLPRGKPLDTNDTRKAETGAEVFQPAAPGRAPPGRRPGKEIVTGRPRHHNRSYVDLVRRALRAAGGGAKSGAARPSGGGRRREEWRGAPWRTKGGATLPRDNSQRPEASARGYSRAMSGAVSPRAENCAPYTSTL